MKYILLFMISMFAVPNTALSSDFMMIPDLEEYEVYTDFDVEDYIDAGFTLDQLRCDIFIVVIDLKDLNRINHRVWGSGLSWHDSRQKAFDSYRLWILMNGYWKNRYNHSFRYRNCS